MEDEPPKAALSLGETIKNMRKSFTEIADQCNLTAPYDDGLFHPFGKIRVEEAKYEFKQSISYIRDVCSTSDALTKLGGPQTLSKYKKNLKNIQEQTNAIENMKMDLQKSCQLGEQHLLKLNKPSSFQENQVSFLNQFVEWMKSVATKAGLVGFAVNLEDNGEISDASGTNEISMWSSTIVVDIVLEQEEVASVKVHFHEKIESNRLRELLRKRHIEEFTEAIKWMRNIEILLATQLATKTLSINALASLESDLLEVCRMEVQSKGEEWALLQGNGIAERNAVALQITFYGSPFYLLQSEEERKKIRSTYRWLREYPGETNNLEGEQSFSSLCTICRAFLTLQRAPWGTPLQTTSLLLPEDQRSDDKIWDAASVTNDEYVLCYSLELYPPIPMSVHFYWLSEICIAVSSGYSDSSTPAQASLLALISGDREKVEQSDEPEFTTVTGGCEMSFIFTGERTRAIRLCNVPFTQCSLLLRILNLLRQQLVFNELLASCTKNTSNSTDALTRTVFEVTFEAPFLIRLLFTLQELGKFVSLDVKVDTGGTISAMLTGPLASYSHFITALLQKSHHIPLSLQKLFKKL